MTFQSICSAILKGIVLGFIAGTIVAYCTDASAYDVPQDAVIKVFTKDGKQIGEMSRSEYKVVRIDSTERYTEEEVSSLITLHLKDMTPIKKNRITIKAGTGYYDMDRSYANNTNTITQQRSAVGGISYSRMLTEEFSLGATILTNETITVDAGVDF